MVISIETKQEFFPALLDELQDPDAVKRITDGLTKRAQNIVSIGLSDAPRHKKYLEKGNLTLKVIFQIGNTDDFAEDNTEDEES